MSRNSSGLDIVKVKLVRDGSLKPYRIVDAPQAAVELIKEELAGYDREVVCVLNLRANKSAINVNIVSMGTLTASMCSPREIFKGILLSNSAGFILFHNHPSGDCHPSKDDYTITKRLQACGQLMDVEMLDHIIVSSGPEPGYYSFKEHSELPNTELVLTVRDENDLER